MMYLKIKKLALTFIVFHVFMLQALIADMMFYYNAAVLPSIISPQANPKGILDTSFGTEGIVLDDYTACISCDAQAESMAIDSSGNIYVTGHSGYYSFYDNGNHMVIWKYTSEGVRDTSFGIDGIVTYEGATGIGSYDIGNSIALDTSGNIYVIGGSTLSEIGTSMVIWKYTPEGDLDTSFGDGGLVVEHGNGLTSNNTAYGRGITLDSLGNIYAVGYRYFNDTYDDMMIWKYTADGDPDTSFGTEGLVRHHNAAGGDSHDVGWSIVLDDSDNIYVSGESSSDDDSRDMVIWKYTSAGVLDRSFDSDGIVVHKNAAGGNWMDLGRKITLDASGNIFVTGHSYNDNKDAEMVIWKYTAAGVLDNGFGTNGIVVDNSIVDGNGKHFGWDIVLDTSGNIFVTGGHNMDVTSGGEMVIWKYNSDGNLDSSFGAGGIVLYGGEDDEENSHGGHGMTLDHSGDIYVTGYGYYTDEFNDTVWNMAIWKYK